jgi:endonuclease/exonuclease/phosphatase family metal-dependent hydrolase
VLVRTWNVFHGNSQPPQRRAFLEGLVRLAVADRPDVVCLQELPVWALDELAGWSGYAAVGAVAARPRLGPFPSTAEVGRAITSLNHGLFRSAFTGQANAVLVGPQLELLERRLLELNPRRFRRKQAEWLSLGLPPQLAWAKERRVCQVLRIRRDERTFLLANLHASSYPPDERLADAELLRAAVYTDGVARPDEPVILCGDFNVTFDRSRTQLDLVSPDWGFSQPAGGIDQIIVRGFELERGPERWPLERRERDGVVLSDHAPVDAVIA